MSQKQVNISYRDCAIGYNIDFKTVAQLATEHGIDWYDMKKALRSYGFVIRKGEVKPTEPNKGYTVNLVDTEKVVAEEAPVTKAAAAVTTVQA